MLEQTSHDRTAQTEALNLSTKELSSNLLTAERTLLRLVILLKSEIDSHRILAAAVLCGQLNLPELSKLAENDAKLQGLSTETIEHLFKHHPLFNGEPRCSDSEARALAVDSISALNSKLAAAVLKGIVQNDPDPEVKAKAVSSLQSLQERATPKYPIRVSRAVTIEDFKAIEELQRRIWGFSDRELIPDFMQAMLSKLGGQVMLAQLPVGFALSYISVDQSTGEKYLYLDLLGVDPTLQSMGIGLAIQQAMRREALATGINRFDGTWDPMETRNANLYLRGLGAVGHTFERDYYGSDYATNYEKLPAHRFRGTWYLDNHGAPQFPANTTELLQVKQGSPELNQQELKSDKPALTLALPLNFQELKGSDLALAKLWQDTVADAIEYLLGHGYRAMNFRINKELGLGQYLFLKV